MQRPAKVRLTVYDPGGDDLLSVFLDYRIVLASMLRQIVGWAEVDDIIQETYLRSFEAATKKRIYHPKSFMYKTARNLALNLTARAGYSRSDCIDDFSCSSLCPSELFVSPPHESDEKYKLFCEAVATLPERCQQAFFLKKVQGYSQREIADQMRISESTVEQHVAKGLLVCAQHLAARGYGVASKRANGGIS